MPRAPSLSSAATLVRSSVFADLQRKIDERTASGASLIPLQIGDIHLPPPEGARLSAAESADAEDLALYRYGPIAGLPKLREAAAAHLASRGFSIDPSREVLIGCGATHALFCAAKTVLDPGDDVLLFAPYWPLAPGVLRACGARPVEVPITSRLYADASFDLGAALEAALTPRTTAVYLITPNNPDGKVLARSELEAVAAFAKKHDLWVFADEVYAEYAFERPHVSIATLPGMASRTISASSFSKSHGLAGARVGFIVAPEAVIAAARRISTHTVYNVPLVAQRSALAALETGGAWVAAAKQEYMDARNEAARRLEGKGARFGLADGGAYLFLDFTELLGERPLQVLLEAAIDEGVLLAPGAAFGEGFERCARLCYTGVSRSDLALGITRLCAAMASVG